MSPAYPSLLTSLRPQPACDNARLALFAFRRMGAHGLSDAHVAQAMIGRFGSGFRRPLVLMRAFMADLSTYATGPIAIAPCCCPRITAAEQAILSVFDVADRPERARLLLADLLGSRHVEGVMASAAAVAQAFADAGCPIDPTG